MPSLRKSRSSYVDPTQVRLSDNFLLSDLMGCHSVYTKGHPNLFEDPDGSKLAEGQALAENVLEPLIALSPLSVTYGYISLDLARRIVTYQSPEKPSYHQWNDGAACDVVVHRHVNQERPPILLAAWMDRKFPMSRTITYAESEGICVGTKVSEIESGKPRRALYENRHLGSGKKPSYINYSNTSHTRAKLIEQAKQFHSDERQPWWRGEGYPTYHGGGIRQLQHVRVGEHCLYSDFMYSTEAIREGHKNALLPTDAYVDHVRQVGAVYDAALALLGVNRLSIVKAYEQESWAKNKFNNWRTNWQLWLVPPVGTPVNDVADALSDLRSDYPYIRSIGAGSNGIATVGGIFNE